MMVYTIGKLLSFVVHEEAVCLAFPHVSKELQTYRCLTASKQ